MEVQKILVVRTVSRTGRVEHDGHQSRVPSTDPTCGLDVLGGRLRLTHHGHQSQPVHVDADGDHVGGEKDIHGLVVRQPPLDLLETGRDLAGVGTTGQLGLFLDLPPFDAVPVREVLQIRLDIVVDLEFGRGQQPEAVEVPDERPVGVAYFIGRVGPHRLVQKRRIGTDEQRGLARARREETDVLAAGLSFPGVSTANQESRASSPAGGNWETLRSNSALPWSAARRMVAVEAMTFGRSERRSTAVSYRPVSVPRGPEMRCSSSWTISSGGGVPSERSRLKRAAVLSRQGMAANLSTVAITSVGRAW